MHAKRLFNFDVTPSSFVQLLRWRALHQSQQPAYTFLTDGDKQEAYLTYEQLDRQARAIAAMLQSVARKGDRVLLLYPPGLDYVAGFLGCLYAGVIAVPAYPPDPTRLNRSLPRLQAIVDDAQATLVLTTSSILSMTNLLKLQGRLEAFASKVPIFRRAVEWLTPGHRGIGPTKSLTALNWIATDGLEKGLEDRWQDPHATTDSLAFLQYTSGSTGTPKGVMLTHGNLLHNSALISHGLGITPETEGVIWLPIYHDMGLIGGVLQPLYVGCHVTLMSPLAFLQWPLRWLNAISRIKDKPVISGGPNFAYDLCIRKISSEQKASLNLSNWVVAFSGAEPVRAETIEQFAKTFAPSGFRREAFYPCYGLAEATLMVTGGLRSEPPIIRRLDKKALTENRFVETSDDAAEALRMVGCGQALLDEKIAIVDPDSLTRCAASQIGEIWVASPSIAQGYWNNPTATQEIFQAYIAGTNEGPFMRTGDLGCLHDGELFVAGRLKDLIIIRGRNHYPQDIELTVERCHPALRPGCGAAFSIEAEGEERLVVVQEVRQSKKLDLDAVINAIRRAVTETHELQVYAIALIKPRSIAKTSSGKIQRRATKQAFLSGSLELVKEWRSTGEPLAPAELPQITGKEIAPPSEVTISSTTATAAAIKSWLAAHLAEVLHLPSEAIDPRQPFASFGLDSAQTVSLTGDLAAWLGRPVAPTLAWDYPTIEQLANHLASEAPKAIAVPQMKSQVHAETEPIAVIGMGCRFPGAKNPEEFWELLRQGVDAIREVPAERWNIEEYYDPNPGMPGKMVTRWGGFIDHVDQFDHQFFGISPREAVQMDPQQRLLLEVAWEALEDAGQTAEEIAGSKTGVFIGISTNDYSRLTGDDTLHINAYSGTGNALSIAANRLSYLLDLRGPSMSIDTACSSSLVAVHYACQSLRQGECELALAGGVNLILSPAIAINFSQAGVMAPDGRCKTFDARADGYVRGEGAGVVILKRLSKALQDGDPIYAVIRGSAVNSDGRSNGLMAPNRLSQEACIREAYQQSGISPGSVQYVEAHGTGTNLGDPIEVQALGSVLTMDRPQGRLCALGSVKTNIGHLEAAAGVAGLIKVVLCLKHRLLPPNLHFEKPNPLIPFDELPFVVQQNLGPWPNDSEPLIAGITSLGFGGTNCHLVVAEPPRREVVPAQTAETRRVYLLPLSAHTPEALQELARSYQAWVSGNSAAPALTDICYTASLRRTPRDHRLALVIHSKEELVDTLNAFLQKEPRQNYATGHKPAGSPGRLVFVFPGQGAQWWAMGRELLQHEPVFRAKIQECDRLLRKHADWSLLEELQAEEAKSRINEIDIIQPALFAVQVALAALWRSWEVKPDAVVGHSMGEVAAAHIAGVLSLEDAVAVIYHRSRLLKRNTGKGAMAAVELSLTEAQQALQGYEDRLSVAVHAGPKSTVLSGDPQALEEVLATLQRREIFCRVLRVDVAAHNPQVEPLRQELVETLRDLQPRESAVPIYSTVTGALLAGTQFDAGYWGKNLRQPVLFSTAIEQLVQTDHTLFVEINPHPILSGSIRSVLNLFGKEGVALPSLRREEEELGVMYASLGSLFTVGYPVAWSAFYSTPATHVALPSIPWQHERHWLEIDSEIQQRTKRQAVSGESAGVNGWHPLIGRHRNSPLLPGKHLWERELDIAEVRFLGDHRVRESIVVPATAHLEMALEAASEVFGEGALILQNVSFRQALMLPENEPRTVQVIVSAAKPGHASFQIFSQPHRAARYLQHGDDQQQLPWTLHSMGIIGNGQKTDAEKTSRSGGINEILVRCTERVSGEAHFLRLRQRGLQLGPTFQGIEEIWRRDGEAVGKIFLAPGLENQAGSYYLHPALFDACFQIVSAAVPIYGNGVDSNATYLPVSVGELRFYRRPGPRLFSHAVLHPFDHPDSLTYDVRLLDEDGSVLAEILDLGIHRVGSAKKEKLTDWLYELQWQPSELTLSQTTRHKPEPRPAETWLIFADTTGVAQKLAGQMETLGARCVLVTAGENWQAAAQNHFTLNPNHPEDFRRLLQEAVEANQSPCHGIVYLWSLDAATDIAAVDSLVTGSVLHLLQALPDAGWQKSPRLWLITRGAQIVGVESSSPAIMQSPLWGLGRVIAREQPELQSVLVDLDPNGKSEDSEILLQILWNPDREDHIALRNRKRYVQRLVPMPAEKLHTENRKAEPQERRLTIPAASSFHLQAVTPGPDGIQCRPFNRRAPAAGEIEIEVCAAGLNSRDVALITDMRTNSAAPLGLECAGRIVNIGAEVEGFRTGDEVIAIALQSLGSHTIAPADLTVRKPISLSFEEAATIPFSFLTAYYALHELGRLRTGERVLIHNAAEGAGLAAVQIAQMIGAEVFVTVNSAEQQALLSGMSVKHVLSLPSLDFADEILQRTDGEGVDVILNSLTGETVIRSLATLRAYGRFLELGNGAAAEQNSLLDLSLFRQNLSFFAIDMEQVLKDRPDLMRSLLLELIAHFNAGKLKPLPHRTFGVADTISAFRHLADGRNLGKVIVSLKAPERAPQEISPETALVRSDGAYLITGGFGALGLLAAQWLAKQGARHIVLLGLKGADDEADKVIAELCEAGVNVMPVNADVGEVSQLASVLAAIAEKMPPLRGIIHAAGLLDDSTLQQMDQERFRKVMRPKVPGSWNLHNLTLDMPLDFFVCYSSVAAIFGSPGQSNYAAANAFMDGLAHYRAALGFPALSINWGPWSQVGLAARPDRGGRLEVKGVNLITPEIGMQLLELLLRQKNAQVMVASINWEQLLAFYSADNAPPMFAGFLPEKTAAAGEQRGKKDRLKREQLLAAEPSQRQEILEAYLQGQLARVVGVSPAKISRQHPLNAMGLDSLMAIELKNTIDADLKIPLPIATLLQGPTIVQLAAQMLSQLSAVPAVPKMAVIKAAPTPVAEGKLSPSQKALWFQHQLAPQSVPNLIFVGRLRMQVDVETLQRAFQAVVDRHPSLRTTFFIRNGEPWQRIHPQFAAFFRAEDATQWSMERLNERMDEEIHHIFDLETGPLLRAHVFLRAPQEHILLLVSHHIVNDLWSQTILMKELGELYANLNATLPPLEVQYTDFVRWQEETLAGPEGERLWNYWQKKLAGELPVLDLPTDRPRPPVQTYRGALKLFTLDAELTNQLKTLSDRHGATLYMTLLAAFTVLLHRYSGQEEVIVASPTTGRSAPELAGVVGYFVNPVMLRSNLSGHPSFTQFLEQVRGNVLEMFDHQDYPFALLVEKLQPARDPSRTPIFQVMFVFQKAHLLEAQSKSAFAGNGQGGQMTLGGLTFEPMTADIKVTPFELTLMMAETNDGLSATLYYNSDLFEADTIAGFTSHFETLLRSIVANPDQSVSRLPILSAEEQREILVQWNDTRRDGELTIARSDFAHRWFEAQVERAPEATAVVFTSERLTYRELNQRANQLAFFLQQLGVQPEVRVAICLERSVEMVVAALAVLKAGGAYVPMDASYPDERLNFMLQDAGVSVLLTHSSLAHKFSASGLQTICLDEKWNEIALYRTENPTCDLSADNLAYIIYTSGSTGRPKGVMLAHRSVGNMIRATSRGYHIDTTSRVLQFASFSFDACVQEMLATLATGAALHLTTPATLLSPHAILQQLRDEQITNLTLPPSMLAILPDEDLPALRTIVSAGEACSREVAARWSPGRHFINAYGPTEATVCTAYNEITAIPENGGITRTGIAIGRPIDNFQVYILDRQLNPAPVGVPGELHIGGIGLARGYHQQPALTAARFIPNPFSQEAGARLYKTGDLARFLPDGNIEFLGRLDYQVKIRGFRIELEEIETILQNHPQVENAIIKARPERNQLVAYYTAKQNGALSPEPHALKTYLQNYFPDYMVPSAYVRVETMPLTPSGKVDRRALPDPDAQRPAAGETLALPRNEVERTLAELWQQVLNMPAVGINDNFFDMGGHSLNLIQIQLKIKEAFNKEISVVDLFRFPTIMTLANYLSQAQSEPPSFQKTQQRAARQREALDRQRQHARSRRKVQ